MAWQVILIVFAAVLLMLAAVFPGLTLVERGRLALAAVALAMTAWHTSLLVIGLLAGRPSRDETES